MAHHVVPQEPVGVDKFETADAVSGKPVSCDAPDASETHDHRRSGRQILDRPLIRKLTKPERLWLNVDVHGPDTASSDEPARQLTGTDAAPFLVEIGIVSDEKPGRSAWISNARDEGPELLE